MDAIPFNPRRFRSAASAYLQGRAAYAPALFRRIVQLCRLDRSHRVMDLGCGPGPIAVALAPFVGEVVGIDPEPEMLKAAAENAAGAGVDIKLIEGSSYDLGPHLGRFRLTTMGRSFHWMDRPGTLKQLDAMIDPGGAVALLHDEHPAVPDNAWYERFQEITRPYAEGSAAKRIRSEGWIRHEAVLLDSPFSHLEQVAVIERRATSVDALAMRMWSMSSLDRARLGARADDLEREMRAAMSGFATDGVLAEVVSSSALIAWRAGEAS